MSSTPMWAPAAISVQPGPGTAAAATSTSASAAENRRKQINTLLIFNQNVSEVVPDSGYRVDFEVGKPGQKMALVISLPPGFPQHQHQRPSVSVRPPGLLHPWIEPGSGSVIGARGLNSFNWMHSDLGRVVQVIRREFELRPPVFPEQQNGNPGEDQAAAAASSERTAAAAGTTLGTSGPAWSATPRDVRSRSDLVGGNLFHSGPQQQQRQLRMIPEIDLLSPEELRDLMEDEGEDSLLAFCLKELPAKYTAFLEDLDQELRETAEAVQRTLEEAQRLDREVRGFRNRAQDRAAEVGSLQVDVAASNRAARSALSDRYSAASIRSGLTAASLRAEELSETCAEDLLDGRLGVEQFVKRYLELRTEHHLGRVGADHVSAGMRDHARTTTRP